MIFIIVQNLQIFVFFALEVSMQIWNNKTYTVNTILHNSRLIGSI